MLLLQANGPVQVIAYVGEEVYEEPTEEEWLRAAANEPAYAFLHDPEEDIYTIADGKPYHGER
ncbi:MAG: hypothetical protein M3Z04_23715 [Chloroflexota bacterium]|nr:hypothetical protein [Chloroflexota bacterium]